ncbi:MAG: hypothetical protein J7L37_07260 [Thermococcus sp.]|nr:hypothetical protein [Thermococcus sp.]
MRVFIRDYLLPWLLLIGFWVALWTISSEIRDNLNPLSVLVVLILLVAFLIAALHFVGKALERYGYSREDIKHLPEIIEKTHGRLYIAKEIFDIIGRALVFWGLFASAVLMTGDPVRGVINGISIFARIFVVFIVGILMVIWVLSFPLSVYRILRGEKPDRGHIDFEVKYTLVFTVLLIIIGLMAFHVEPANPEEPFGELLLLGRNEVMVGYLLKMAGLNVLFGVVDFYGPRRARKLTVLALTLIVVAQLWITWKMFAGNL